MTNSKAQRSYSKKNEHGKEISYPSSQPQSKKNHYQHLWHKHAEDSLSAYLCRREPCGIIIINTSRINCNQYGYYFESLCILQQYIHKYQLAPARKLERRHYISLWLFMSVLLTCSKKIMNHPQTKFQLKTTHVCFLVK